MGEQAAGARRDEGRGRASHVRYIVLVFAFLLSVITYIDRVCISVAAPSMSAELHLSRLQMGLVFSAFTLAYALMEVPSGWWGDVVGARRVLTRIVVWWSCFTALTGAAWSFLSLAAFRFLFGAGEAGAFPNCARIFSRWMPATQRGLAHGIIFTGSRLGGSLTPYTVVALLAAVGWRRSFGLFGAAGCVLGGLLTDGLVRRRGLKFGRRAVGIGSLLSAALFLFASVFLRDPWHAMIAISLSAFSNDLTLSACWAVCVDIGGEYAGTVSGCMNTFGNLGGALSPLLVSVFLERFHSWQLAFYVASVTYLLAALLWLRIDPTEPVLDRAMAQS